MKNFTWNLSPVLLLSVVEIGKMRVSRKATLELGQRIEGSTIVLHRDGTQDVLLFIKYRECMHTLKPKGSRLSDLVDRPLSSVEGIKRKSRVSAHFLRPCFAFVQATVI